MNLYVLEQGAAFRYVLCLDAQNSSICRIYHPRFDELLLHMCMHSKVESTRNLICIKTWGYVAADKTSRSVPPLRIDWPM